MGVEAVGIAVFSPLYFLYSWIPVAPQELSVLIKSGSSVTPQRQLPPHWAVFTLRIFSFGVCPNPDPWSTSWLSQNPS